MRIIIFTTLFLLSSAHLLMADSFLVKFPGIHFSDTITWLTLNNLEYKEVPHEVYGTVYLPEFSKEIKKLANKRVIIRGYLVPVDKTTWALSKNTYASCFFCGKAGPETVMGLNFKGDPGKLKMDANVVITGKFILNGSNVEDWMFSLSDAEILSIR